MAILSETAAIHTAQPDSTPAAGHRPLPTLWGTLNWVSYYSLGLLSLYPTRSHTYRK